MTTKEKTTADGVPHSKLKQPSCPWCGMDTRCGSGWHVEGFREQGLCGSKWFPDFEGGHLEGREQSTACKEIARLKAQLSQAERVVVPELDGAPVLQEEFADNGEHSHWNLFDSGSGVLLWTEAPEEEWHKHHRRPAHSVPASRVLKDGEMPIKISEWERIQAAIAKLNEQHDPVKMAERIQRIADEHKAAHQPQKGPPFEPISILRDGWTTTHGTAQDSALRAQGKEKL